MFSTKQTAGVFQPIGETKGISHTMSLYINQAKEIVSKMSLEEKLGFMLLVTTETLKPGNETDKIAELGVGGVLAEANTTFGSDTLAEWQKATKDINRQFVKIKAYPQLVFWHFFGNDAITGNEHIVESILAPHNRSLAATNNPKLAGQLARMTTRSLRESGSNNVYTPQVDMDADGINNGMPLWGRNYESHPFNPKWVYLFAFEHVKAVLEEGLLPTLKHWPGPRKLDGTDNPVDEGDINVEALGSYMEENAAGYLGGFQAAKMLEQFISIMVSYHFINGVACSQMGEEFFNAYLFGKGFNGVVMSDYSSVEKAILHANQNGCYLITVPNSASITFENLQAALKLDKNAVIQHNEQLYYIDIHKGKVQPLDMVHENYRLLKSQFATLSEKALADDDQLLLIGQLTFKQGIADTVNSGVDMLMMGPNLCSQYKTVAELKNIMVEAFFEKRIHESRIDQAVTHIVATKIAQGLVKSEQESLEVLEEFANGHASKQFTPYNKKEHADLALEAASQSLVVLKNKTETWPIIKENIHNIVFLGAAALAYRNEAGVEYDTPKNTGNYPYNNIGRQCGGWNLRWQGREGNDGYDESATSISQAFEKTRKDCKFFYPCEGKEEAQAFYQLLEAMKANPKLAEKTETIAVLAEPPYAEFMGDIGNGPGVGGAKYADYLKINPSLPKEKKPNLIMAYDEQTRLFIQQLKALKVKVTTIVLAGRNVLLNHGKNVSPQELSEVIIAAGLPGTQGGEAIVKILTGKYPLGGYKDEEYGLGRSNRLPSAWLQLKEEKRNISINTILTSDDVEVVYPSGHGLRQIISELH